MELVFPMQMKGICQDLFGVSMKKILLFSFAVVATSMVISCTKEINDDSVVNKVASLTIGAPLIDDPESKVSFQSGFHTRFAWEANDAIQLFSFTKSESGTFTKWGNYTTATGGITASFSGTVPVEYWGTSVVAVKTPTSANMVYSSSAWRVNFYIPPTQTGKGLDYSLFTGLPVYDEGTNSFSVESTEDLSGDILKGPVKLRTALTYFEIPDLTNDIVEIKITASTAFVNADSNQNRRAFGFNCQTSLVYNLNSEWMGKVVTISNGESLTGEVSFASRGLSKGSTLKFELKNSIGKYAKKTVTLNNAISEGWVSKLGTLPFTDSDFTGDSYDE